MLVNKIGKDKMIIFKLVVLISVSSFSQLLLAKENQKEMIQLEYELKHNVCEKNSCQSTIISSGKVNLSLDKENDKYFWKYEPINIKKDKLDIVIRLKASASFENNIKRSLEVGLSEKHIIGKKQISWGEGIIESSVWPSGVSMIVKGSDFQLESKIISPSVLIRISNK